ncbi:hypothetical protein Pla22_18870 [Rubripirellula amarantea]|uniref:Permuted papain-like amidase enzyme, YaeF/YiiX, C92 family n=1 Tax=Rubripirellula amarantea TaxID=2527999 RepID=A0A5C5WU81_9BACT|nr:YiiX/YebB-like N1pC/P60 family cysteine hydrolase [Rubripirellula amarantea]TWT54246.1 hypothetical protein Pla22_18870 [Rubripirellula amarantea]
MNDPLHSNVLAVLDLAEHFDRLRSRADQFIASFDTGTRGFFSPSEDDDVTSLWVSYHTGRSALLETIHSLRNEFGSLSSADLVAKHGIEFLVGYAASLVLVDAARSIRDRFSRDALVRRKLNEPLVLHGIPQNSFDRIQESLTDPRNALAVRQFGQYYEVHRNELQSIANAYGGESRASGKLVDLIDALRFHIQVSASQYIRARAADRSQQVTHRVIRGGAVKVVYAIQQWGSRLVSRLSTNPSHEPSLPSSIVRELNSMIVPGDVFVTRKEFAITNYFLPGFWPHAALYVGEGRVVESLKDGVHVRGMESPYGNDCVAIIRPKLQSTEIDMAIQRAHTHVGKPYDFDFDFTRSDRMVCTEVVYRSYEGVGGMQFELTKRAGRQTLSAEDLLSLAVAGIHFEPLAVYCPSRNETVCQSDAMTEILRNTMGREV